MSLDQAQAAMRERNLTKGKKTKRSAETQLNATTQTVFATVMKLYRRVKLEGTPLQSVYASKKTRLDTNQLNFLCDVELALAAVLPPEVFPFMLVPYGGFDLDDIDIERLASQLIHGGQGRCQSLKHRCAREFQRRGIFPLSKYMTSIKQKGK